MQDGFANTHNEIVLYQPNEEIKLEVRMDEETVWLTQSQIANLFGCSSDNVGLHLKNIFSENELDKNATAEFFSVVQKEGNRNVRRNILHYNLDAILSVGYRVSSINATKFRQWANKVLKDHLLKGYSFNQRIVLIDNYVDETVLLRLAEREKGIDDTVYHIGASIKDLGKKWFAFCKMNISAEEIISRI